VLIATIVAKNANVMSVWIMASSLRFELVRELVHREQRRKGPLARVKSLKMDKTDAICG
jgi:hypothetical protein